MESFSITNDDYVCIGPPESAIRACLQIESGAPPPTCWSEPPASFAGGTVLVHAVDMRIPVCRGGWKASQLFNQAGGLAGGMVWHSSVGESEHAAVRLIREMEEAGAPVICNYEPEEVLAQGVRFVGRYSWGSKDKQFHDPVLDRKDLFYSLFGGPSCFFLPASTARKEFIPSLKDKTTQIEALVVKQIQEWKDAGEEEAYIDQFRWTALGNLSLDIQEMAFPELTCFDKSGVGFAFPSQEYMFGRLWFDLDVKCKAFLFYTYASPECFAEMKLGDTPICPIYYPLMAQVTPNGDVVAMSDRLTTKESAKNALSDMTTPMRNRFLCSLASRSPSTLQQWFANHYVEWNTGLFDMLCSELAHSNESVVAAIIQQIPKAVIKEAGETEVLRFHSTSKHLRDGTLDLNTMDDAYFAATRPSHLARFVEKPVCVAALLGQGYPASSTIAFHYLPWPRTPLADAADKGILESVKLLVDAGADIDESVEGDPWNAIVYAVAGGKEEVVKYLKTRFPDHSVWKRKDIPVAMKRMPSTRPSNSEANAVPAEVVLGTLDDVKKECEKSTGQ